MKRSIQDCQEHAINKDGVCLSKFYKNNKQKLDWQCNKCNHCWSASWNSISRGRWCPKCAVRLTINDCYIFANKKNGKCLSNKYVNNKSPLMWECGDCSYVWETSFVNARNGWCPKCAGKLKKDIKYYQELAIKKRANLFQLKLIHAQINYYGNVAVGIFGIPLMVILSPDLGVLNALVFYQ